MPFTRYLKMLPQRDRLIDSVKIPENIHLAHRPRVHDHLLHVDPVGVTAYKHRFSGFQKAFLENLLQCFLLKLAMKKSPITEGTTAFNSTFQITDEKENQEQPERAKAIAIQFIASKLFIFMRFRWQWRAKISRVRQSPEQLMPRLLVIIMNPIS